MERNPKFKYVIWIAAAIYLIYLAVEIFQDGVLGGQMKGGMLAVGWICSVGFLAIGVFFGACSVRAMIRISKEEKAEAEEEEKQNAADEKQKEISDRAENGEKSTSEEPDGSDSKD